MVHVWPPLTEMMRLLAHTAILVPSPDMQTAVSGGSPNALKVLVNHELPPLVEEMAVLELLTAASLRPSPERNGIPRRDESGYIVREKPALARIGRSVEPISTREQARAIGG